MVSTTTCTVLIAITLAIAPASALPIGESNAAEVLRATRNADLGSAMPFESTNEEMNATADQAYSFTFNCSDRESHSQPSEEEQQSDLGFLQTGVRVLYKYSSNLYDSQEPSLLCSRPVDSICRARSNRIRPEDVTTQHVACFAGALQGYANHTMYLKQADITEEQRNQTETLLHVLNAVLRNFNQVLQPRNCNCSDDCFEIPHIEPTVPDSCSNLVRNMEYHLTQEALATLRLLSRWLKKQGVPMSAKPSEYQWINQAIPSNTPDHTTLSTITC